MSETKERLYYFRLKARYEHVLEVQANNEQEAYDRALVAALAELSPYAPSP